MIWIMNVASVRAEMWESNQKHSKDGSAKSQWVDINLLYLVLFFFNMFMSSFGKTDSLFIRHMVQGASLSSSSSHSGFTLFAAWQFQGLCFYKNSLFFISFVPYFLCSPWTLVIHARCLNQTQPERCWHPRAALGPLGLVPELPTRQGLICGMPPLPKQNFRNGFCLSHGDCGMFDHFLDLEVTEITRNP